MDYLGHIVATRGVEAESKKIQAMQEWSTLKDLRELSCFLGLTS